MAFTSAHLYYDDLEIGQAWESYGRTVTEADIVNFAGFSGDFNAIHIDHEFAKNTPFRRVFCHGFAVFSMASGMSVQSPPTRIVAMTKVRFWNFYLPVFAGDTVRLRSKVAEKTLKGRGRRGEVVWAREIVNQDGKAVQGGEIVTLIECRPQTKPIEADAEVAPTGVV
ncbi:MAG TPA: MaoC/PaaZ C-terminal domain-containing protein [Fimbriiglobus sp.]|jgi:acyl dehydratase